MKGNLRILIIHVKRLWIVIYIGSGKPSLDVSSLAFDRIMGGRLLLFAVAAEIAFEGIEAVCVEAIVHPAALLSGCYEPGFFKRFEMKRQLRLSNAEAIAHIAHTKFALLQ